MPDEYDAIRQRLTNYEKGLYFELGRAHERGETPERGWVRQFRIETSKGPRVLDNARTEGRGTRGVERKSGRINERDTREQLVKERAGLESGQLTHSRWETVAGEKIPRAVAAELQAMARDFPGRFHHEIVSRADALRAMRLGRSLMSKQLELMRVYELDRAERARERLAKIREIVRAQERAEKFRKIQHFREAAARGRADAPQQAERARQAQQTPDTERARVEREAAERVAREFPVPDRSREREAADVAEQAAREAADTARAAREAAEARAAAEKGREAASQALDQARNAAFKELDEKGRLSEVERLLWLGQATHPQAAVRQSPGHAPGVERGGMGQGQDRSRGVVRDR
jgi:membrane protein involved in colicin uptake